MTNIIYHLAIIIISMTTLAACSYHKPKAVFDDMEITQTANSDSYLKNDNIFRPTDDKINMYIIPTQKNDTVAFFFIPKNNKKEIELIPVVYPTNQKSKYKIYEITQINNDSLIVKFAVRKFFKYKDYYNVNGLVFIRNTKSQIKYEKNRYKEEVFPVYKLTADIEYGEAKGMWTSYPSEGNTDNYSEIIKTHFIKLLKPQKQQKLLLDLYQPLNDYVKKRPLIVLIHGGGFFVGDKENSFMNDICPHFAKCGYTVASINYRLGFTPSQTSIDRAGYKALQDARAAIRFLVNNADEYGIDTSRIYVGGTSAGAITSLNVAFMDNDEIPDKAKEGLIRQSLGNIDDSGNKIPHNFSIKAVINLWGAINDSTLIDDYNRVSLLSVHGSADSVVPIGYDTPFQDIGAIAEVVMPKMCGSRIISRRAKALGMPEKLIEIPNAGHSPIYDEENHLNDTYYFIKQEITDFLYPQNFPTSFENYMYKIFAINDNTYQLENTSISADPNIIKQWNVIGGYITSENEDKIKVLWFSNAPHQSVELTTASDIGATKTYTKRIR